VLDVRDITAIENRYVECHEPSLEEAREALEARLHAGARDRETLLRLLFLEWYSIADDGFYTGLECDWPIETRFVARFEELGGMDSSDPELIYVVGVMANAFPYYIGDEKKWEEIGSTLLSRYAALPPEHQLRPEHFRGRGAYGAYFEHQLTAEVSGRLLPVWWHPRPWVSAIRRVARGLWGGR
jgi:hypothetical protein